MKIRYLVDKSVLDLTLLEDEELWRAAQNSLSDDARGELEALNLKQQRKGLTPAERTALERLVHQYDKAMLLRAEAVRLLKERGHEISKLLTVR